MVSSGASTLASSPQAAAGASPAAEPRLPFRLRPDLIVKSQQRPQGPVWIVHDPVSLSYFHLGPREWFILQQLDGRRSLPEIRARFEQTHRPQTISVQELQRFVQRTWSDGLLLCSRVGGVGAHWQSAASSLQRRTRLFKWLQLLAIRLPGIHPHQLLAGMIPLGRLVFHPGTMLMVALLATISFVLAVLKVDVVLSRLPSLGEYFQGEQLLWLALAVAIVKILHELGHAVACEVYGGHCHEIGVMLLCFVPCLYCDVSDSWLFPERWRRIVVAAAGMYVELALATLFFWIWLSTVDGALNALALNIVLVASLGTVLANGNPLLKYDGYFILSDLVGIPNLAERARAELVTAVQDFFFWRRTDETGPRSHRGLATFAAVSWGYRIAVLLGILWAVRQLLQPHGLGVLVIPLAATMALSLVLPLVLRGGPSPLGWSRWLRLRWAHLILVLVLLSGLVVVAGWLPLSFRIRAPLTVEIARPHLVYAAVEGRLLWSIPAEARVQSGELIARLENAELTRKRDTLTRQLRVGRVNVVNLKRQAQTATVILETHLLEAQLEDWQHQLRIVEDEYTKCEIRAPDDGIVYSANRDTRAADPSPRTLPEWSGDLFDPNNRGCLVAKGTPICQLSRTGKHAVALVGQDQIAQIQHGTPADVWLHQSSPGVFHGRVVEISREPLQELPRQVAARGLVPSQLDSSGKPVPRQPTYRVTLELPEWPDAVVGSTGEAKIHAPAETWVRHAGRYLRQQFRWP